MFVEQQLRDTHSSPQPLIRVGSLDIFLHEIEMDDRLVDFCA